MIDPQTALFACRFGYDCAVLLLWGAGAFAGFFAPAGMRVPLWTRMERGRTLAALTMIITSLASPCIHAALIGDGWSDGINPGLLRDMLLTTSIGTSLACQSVATLGIAAMSLGVRNETIQTRAIAFFAATGILGTSMTGHAVMDSGLAGLLHQANDIVHLLSGGLWIGSLPAALITLAYLKDPTRRLDAAVTLSRFSVLGHFTVAVSVLTGALNAILVLKTVPASPFSTYMQMLAAKMLLVAAMILLALINRYVLVPKLRRNASALQALKAGTIAEIALSVCVVALVAWFGMSDPQ